jgi:hypothetical protein
VVPRSGRPRRGPVVQRAGHQRSVRLTSGRRPGDRQRAGHLMSGRRWDDRRRTNHGRQAGHFGPGRRPGMRRRTHARQAVAAGRHRWPDRRNGARALPRAGHRRGGHPHAGHRCAGGHRGSHQSAGRCPADHPHAGHQYEDHQAGNCSPAGCRWWRGHERDGRCSRRRSRETLPGRTGRCRCGTNPALSPVSHPTGCSGPDGRHPSWFCPCFQCRCVRRHRTGPCPSRWRVPDRYSQCDSGQCRFWTGPDRGRHPPDRSGPAPRHHYGPGRPDPARLPRCCSTLPDGRSWLRTAGVAPPRAVPGGCGALSRSCRNPGPTLGVPH